jgi:hypothetical protein
MEARLHTGQAHWFECAVSTLLHGFHQAATPAIGENVPSSSEYRKRVVLQQKVGSVAALRKVVRKEIQALIDPSQRVAPILHRAVTGHALRSLRSERT